MSSNLTMSNKDCRSDTSSDLRHKITNYYDECFIDYRLFWLDSKNLAMHYGYWDTDTKNHSESLLHMNRALSQKLNIKPGDKILDAGCGIGGSSIWLAKHFDVEITAITLTASQVDKAKAYAKKNGVADKITFKQADYCHTPFDDETFDIVWGLESICYAVDKHDFIKEAYRVLKKGGQFIVADGFAFKDEFTPEEWPYIQAFLDGCVVPNLATVGNFRAGMEKCQFQNIEYTDITQKVMPSSEILYKKSKQTYPIEKVLGWLRIRTASQTANYYAAKSQYQIFKQALCGYGIFNAQK